MKKVLLALVLAASVVGSQAQGLVNFLNSSTTLVTLSNGVNNLGSTPTTLGGFRYELFAAPAGTANPALFTSTGLIATNIASAGRFNGGINLAGAGLPLGGTAAILVRGWSSNLGANYAAALVNYNNNVGGYLGQSAIALNFLTGGFNGTATIPSSPAFGGSSGIQGGFALVYAPVPEPSSMALAGIGAASLLIFRRRK